MTENEASKSAQQAKAKTFIYKIVRDYWDDKGERHRKWVDDKEGGLVEMTAEEAQDGVESGALSRVK